MYYTMGGKGGMTFGPATACDAYSTVRYGAVPRVAPGEGEVAVRVSIGDPSTLSRWLVGPIDEVVGELERLDLAQLANAVRSRAVSR